MVCLSLCRLMKHMAGWLLRIRICQSLTRSFSFSRTLTVLSYLIYTTLIDPFLLQFSANRSSPCSMPRISLAPEQSSLHIAYCIRLFETWAILCRRTWLSTTFLLHTYYIAFHHVSISLVKFSPILSESLRIGFLLPLSF